MNLQDSHWIIEEGLEQQVVPYGFVYEIINLQTDKKYIGKKQCKTIKKRPPLKGKKNKRHYEVETDWKYYTGSCNELNLDIKRLGKDCFEFKILKFCNSKSELAYWEAKTQFERDVLLRNDYYNGIINLRISRIKG